MPRPQQRMVTFSIDGLEVSAPENVMLVDGAKYGDVDQHHVLGRGDLEPVDRERHHPLLGAGHGYATAPWIRASGGASSVVSRVLRARASSM